MITFAPAVQADQPVPFQPLSLADLATHPAIPPAIAQAVTAWADRYELDQVAYGVMTANFHDRAPTAPGPLLFSMWLHPDEAHGIYCGGPYYLEISGAYAFIQPLAGLQPDLAGTVWIWGLTDLADTAHLLLIQIQPTRDPIAGEIML
jgi:hypothetical protein